MKKAIYILSGGVEKDKKGDWHTSSLVGQEGRGPAGSILRVAAAIYLYKDNLDLILIPSGGRGYSIQDDELNRPDLADIIESDLVDGGVSRSNIIKEKKSNNTWQQLQELKRIIGQLNLEDVNIISNDWHLPRIKAMIAKDERLSEMLEKDQVRLLSAEKILLKYNKEKWQIKLDSYYKSEQVIKIKKAEERGAQELREGKYELI